MTSNQEIEKILQAYPEEKYPELSEYLTKIADKKNGVKKSLRAEIENLRQENRENCLKRPLNKRGLINWVNSRDELYNLDAERRHNVIINMAMIHIENEIKEGRYKLCLMKKHPIPEINAYLFNIKIEPYIFANCNQQMDEKFLFVIGDEK
jgi:hypothetical protein